jgi:hypothetical protein
MDDSEIGQHLAQHLPIAEASFTRFQGNGTSNT